MAAPELGSFSNGTTGNTTISLNGAGTPVFLEFWAGARSSTTESSDIHSVGFVDIGNAVAAWQSNLAADTLNQTKDGAGASTGVCFTHYAVVTGAISKRVEFKFVSVAAGQFTVNLTAADANYPIYYKVTY